MAGERPIILFTGFEPSGDDHAAAVVRRLLAMHPQVEVHAWGGPRVAEAGATVVEETGQDAVMGVPGMAKIREHRRINARVERWLDEHAGRVRLHVPVDSPAANFPICAMAKRRGIPVAHMVAPQIWAWGRWRIGKLRRMTDFVCCLLPFEERFFSERGVPAKFVGHPLFDEPLDVGELDAEVAGWPEGEPKVALMPGSRPKEIERNFPLLLNAYRTLSAEYVGMRGVVAATTEAVASRARALAETVGPPAGAMKGGWPGSLDLVVHNTDAAIRWADIALAVSGTVTLQIARQRTPMVIVFRTSRLMYEVLGRWLVRTPMFSLPNLIVGRRAVPELIPHFVGHERIVRHAVELIERPGERERQIEALGEVAASFEGKSAAQGAAEVIARLAGLGSPAQPERAVEPATG